MAALAFPFVMICRGEVTGDTLRWRSLIQALAVAFCTFNAGMPIAQQVETVIEIIPQERDRLGINTIHLSFWVNDLA